MSTFLDDLREVQEHVRKNATLDLDVPETGGRIVVRYRPPANENAVGPIIAAYRTTGAASVEQQKQLLVDCCDEVMRRDPETGLLESYDGGPLRFDAGDERWGEVSTARECVAELFSLKKRPAACAGHVDVLFDWLQGLTGDIQARVEGKSRRAASTGS